MKKKNYLPQIITFILSYIGFFCLFVGYGASFVESVLWSAVLALIYSIFAGVIVIFNSYSAFHKIAKKSEQPKKARRLKKPNIKNHKGFLRRLFSKLRLWNIHREWRKSDNGRSIPKMQRKFKKWAKQYPEMAETIGVIISEMHQLAITHDIFEEVVEDSEFGYKGQDSRKVFDHTAAQIRQNFNDIYNLMLLAGANEGQATLKTVDLNALAWELNSNRTKLALLTELNTQIVRLVNQIDSVHDNVMTEAEIEALAILNAVRFSRAAGFTAEANAEVRQDADPPTGTTISSP